MLDRKPISLWDTSAVEEATGQPFEEAGLRDVVVIGGGYTGLSTALHAAEKGLSVHVLEAEHLGYGGSGRNVGLVNAAAWLPPQDIRKQLGPIYGERFVKEFSRAPEYVFSLIEKYQIRCEATRNGTLHAAESRQGLKNLQIRKAEWDRLKEPVDLIGRDEMERMVGTHVYLGGLWDHCAGTINPMGYCRGLARAAIQAGASISTNVRATRLSRDGDHWLVETNRGTVRADFVILGTNAYTDELWPGLSRSFMKVHYFQFATKPMGPAAAHILPDRQGVWDTGKIMFNIRRDAFDRLLVGSMGRVLGEANAGLSKRFAERQIARIFPTLGPVEFEEAWHGQIAMTPDHLPKIYQLNKNLFSPIAYNGRGITTGTLFGKAMADLMSGADPGSLALPLETRPIVAHSPFKAKFYSAAFAINQFWKSI